MSRLTRGAVGPALLVALTLASGCSLVGGSGSGSSPSAGPASTAPSSAPAGAPASVPASPTSAQPTPADPSAPAPTNDLGAPVASRTSTIDSATVTLRLYALQREGAVSHLNFTLSSPVKGTKGLLSTALGDGDAKAGDATYDAADGIQLVDGKNAKLYLVASDGNGRCLCSRGLGSVFVREDRPQLLSATFAAPPADVTTVDVHVPTFGTVKGVPVQ